VPALSDPALQRAAWGTLCYLLLVALMATGVAAVVRHQAAAAGTLTGLLYGPYVLTLVVPMSGHVSHAVRRAAPMTAGLAVQATTPGTGTAPLGPWAGLGVLAAYAAAALAAGWVLLHRRDA
jgi:ABC-2 type transport system permease protein